MSGDREQLIPVLKKSSLPAGMSDEEVAELLYKNLQMKRGFFGIK